MTYTQDDFERDAATADYAYAFAPASAPVAATHRIIAAYRDLVAENERWVKAHADVVADNGRLREQLVDQERARQCREREIEQQFELTRKLQDENERLTALTDTLAGKHPDAAEMLFRERKLNETLLDLKEENERLLALNAALAALSSDPPIVPLTGAMHANDDSVTVQAGSQLTSEVTSAACDEGAE